MVAPPAKAEAAARGSRGPQWPPPRLWASPSVTDHGPQARRRLPARAFDRRSSDRRVSTPPRRRPASVLTQDRDVPGANGGTRPGTRLGDEPPVAKRNTSPRGVALLVPRGISGSPTPGNIPLPSSSRGNRPPIGCGRLRLRRHDSERFEAAPRLQDARGRRSLGLPDAAQSTGRPAGRLTAHAGRAHTRRVLAREIGLPSTHREGGPNPF